MLLMCFWQLNLISRRLVKKALDCSHRKNAFFFFTSHVLQNAAAQSVDDPVLSDGRKTRKSSAESTGKRKERRQEGSGRGSEKYIARRDTISKKGSCGKLTQMLFFLLSPSRLLLTLPPPALSSLPSWAPLPCSLIGRETLGTITGISFHCSPAPLG